MDGLFDVYPFAVAPEVVAVMARHPDQMLFDWTFALHSFSLPVVLVLVLVLVVMMVVVLVLLLVLLLGVLSPYFCSVYLFLLLVRAQVLERVLAQVHPLVLDPVVFLLASNPGRRENHHPAHHMQQGASSCGAWADCSCSGLVMADGSARE